MERTEFGPAQRYRVRSRYHCLIEPSLIGLAAGVDRARVILPLATRDKRPLLNFRVTAPNDSAHLLPRDHGAELQARFLRMLARRSSVGQVLDSLPPDLLRAVCAFSPDVWRAFVASARFWPDALQRYLSGGIDVHVPLGTIARLLNLTDRAGALLARQLGEPRDAAESSSECVLLALPQMRVQPADVETVETLVQTYLDVVRTFSAAADAGDEHAAAFLSGLAEYGRRWEVLFDVDVPLGEPFSMAMEEDRTFALRRGTVTHRTSLREAASSHVEGTVTDRTIVVRRLDVIDVDTGASVGIGPADDEDDEVGPLELARVFGDSFSLYTSDPAVPYYADLRVRLGLAGDVLWPAWVALATTSGALVATALIHRGKDFVDTLAILVVPTTFAATFTLIREESALAARLQRTAKVALGIAVAALWVVAAARLLGKDFV